MLVGSATVQRQPGGKENEENLEAHTIQPNGSGAEEAAFLLDPCNSMLFQTECSDSLA